VVPEDYFRVLKQRKEIEKRGRPDAANFDSVGESLDSHRKPSPKRFGMPHWLSLIDPEMEDEEALKFIDLPQETLYLIDKVVRQKAKAGPIGVDNSEFINIEIEQEYKEKNKYINNLSIKHRRDEATLEAEEQEEDDNKENHNNQRLFDRLSTAAARVPTGGSALGNTNANQSHISAGAQSMQRS